MRKWASLGANKYLLIIMNYALIRSALDYGGIIYGSPSATQLKVWDRVQSRALRLCSRSFPVVTLQVELGEMPLGLRGFKRAYFRRTWKGTNNTKTVLEIHS